MNSLIVLDPGTFPACTGLEKHQWTVEFATAGLLGDGHDWG
jgi:hypothetical protein